MAASRRIRVSKLIDKDDLWPAGDNGIEVHFLKPSFFVLNPLTRNDFEPLDQRFRFLPAVRLDHAYDNVIAVSLAGTRRLEHCIGFSNTRRCAHKDAELSCAALLPPGRFEQSFRRRALVMIAS